jgi:hypothetical protein
MKIYKTHFFVFCLFALSFFVGVGNVKALTLSPVRETLVVDAGKDQIAFVYIKNDSEIEQTFLFETDAFGLDPDTGHIQFGKNDEAKSWVVPNYPVLTLKPGETRRVNFMIHIPVGTPPSSHYLALVAKQNPVKGQLSIGERVASLLFLHVSGTVHESISLQDFSSEKNWYFWNPLKMHVQLKNQGTIHAIPQGRIDILNWWGKKIAEIPVNITNRKILPNEKWKEVEELKEIHFWNIGKLHARLFLKYGVTEQDIVAEKSFYFVPWYFVLFGLIFVFGVTFGVRFFKEKK